MVLLEKLAFTPAGNPVAVPIPVAPVVAIVIFGSNVLIHKIGLEEATPAVLLALTESVKGVDTPVATELFGPVTLTKQLYL